MGLSPTTETIWGVGGSVKEEAEGKKHEILHISQVKRRGWRLKCARICLGLLPVSTTNPHMVLKSDTRTPPFPPNKQSTAASVHQFGQLPEGGHLPDNHPSCCLLPEHLPGGNPTTKPQSHELNTIHQVRPLARAERKTGDGPPLCLVHEGPWHNSWQSQAGLGKTLL